MSRYFESIRLPHAGTNEASQSHDKSESWQPDLGPLWSFWSLRVEKEESGILWGNNRLVDVPIPLLSM